MVSMTTATCDHPAQHAGVEQGAEGGHHHDGDREADPVVEPPPDHRHVGDEGAQHQQVALGEVDEFGGLVDQHEPERDQPVDAADRQTVEGQLQEDVQFPSPCPVARVWCPRHMNGGS
jgi:hypothetical protein